MTGHMRNKELTELMSAYSHSFCKAGALLGRIWCPFCVLFPNLESLSVRVAKCVLVSCHRNFQFIKRYSNPDSILKLEKPPVPGNMCGF